MNINWDSQEYNKDFSFVPQYGEDLIGLITKPKGSRVIDLGCGSGTLTYMLADMGFDVIGIDASEEMLSLARNDYPQLKFECADATEFKLNEKADVIFSNAVFHWIDAERQEKLIGHISDALKPNGELVCEFGGHGCAESVHGALEKCFEKRGMKYPRVFYFPTIGEYAPLLEKYGLRVDHALLFDRPTPQRTENGLKDWINMFVKAPFENVPEDTKEDILNEAENILKPKLFVNGKWYIDYVRIRLSAKKIN